MPRQKANPDNLGQKIDRSSHVFAVVKLMYEGVSDLQVIRIMRERYNWKISAPSLLGFRKNFYDKRLAHLISTTRSFQDSQTGRIQTFIDESMQQAAEIKKTIQDLSRQLRILEDDVDFSQRFDIIFKDAFRQYVSDFDPERPHMFLQSPQSKEALILTQIKESMGPDIAGLSEFINTHDRNNTIKLIAIINQRLLDQRSELVKIHNNVFKGYRNYSIMSELAYIFQQYNRIIIEVFFPNKSTMDFKQYERVRSKIMELYDELQIRYQGVDTPARPDRPTKPKSAAEAETGAESAKQQQPQQILKQSEKPPSNLPKPPLTPTLTQEQQEQHRQRQLQHRLKMRLGDDNLNRKQVHEVKTRVQTNLQNRDVPGTPDNIFAVVINANRSPADPSHQIDPLNRGDFKGGEL